MANIETAIIEGAAGLVKSHTVTQDSETTVMRTGKDLQELQRFINSTECDPTAQSNVFKSLFRGRGKSVKFTGSHFTGQFNTRDGEVNG